WQRVQNGFCKISYLLAKRAFLRQDMTPGTKRFLRLLSSRPSVRFRFGVFGISGNVQDCA
ncbi:MAG: hypothetical protein J6S92_02435, partial [Oscillospiraceae bacterium]|nr:hypothetical protein [Oscillospiraceae bacterium]